MALRTKILPTLILILPFTSATSTNASTIGVILDGNKYGIVDDSTGAVIPLSVLPVTNGRGLAKMNSAWYLEDFGDNLLELDPVTGLSRLIGHADPNLTITSFAGSDSGLFAIDWFSNLYSINPLTGHATLIGATGLAANHGDLDTSLASDGTYLYYTLGAFDSPDELYRLDPATGSVRDIGNTGISGVSAAAFVDATLELFQYGQCTNYIYTQAGESHHFKQTQELLAAITGGGAQVDLNSQSGPGPQSTPEPRSFWLVAVGSGPAFLLLKRRIRGTTAPRRAAISST